MNFAMRGFKGPTIHTTVCRGKLEIKGKLSVSGPQVVDDNNKWIYELFKNNPDIKHLAVNREDGSHVYAPMEESK